MVENDAELPRALVKRIVKNKLAELGGDGEGRKDYNLNKDALLAFSESAKVFINYLTATANDICKENKRQTVSAEDVLQALDDLDFIEFIEPLKECLEVFKKGSREKNKRKAEQVKQRRQGKSGGEADKQPGGVEEGGEEGEDGGEGGGVGDGYEEYEEGAGDVEHEGNEEEEGMEEDVDDVG